MVDVVIDGEKAVALLRKAVAEKGEDYIYPFDKNSTACQYELDGKPGCIVGYALSYVGVTPEQLVALDDADENFEYECENEIGNKVTVTPNGTAIEELVSCGAVKTLTGVTVEPEAAAIFRDAQINQDGGTTWGYALDGVLERF